MPDSPKQPSSQTSKSCPEATPRWVYLALLLAVFMVGLGLRLYALDADSLWLDEIFTASTARLDIRSIPSYLAASDPNPPLIYLYTSLAVDLWGNSEFIIRLPAVLLGSLSILLLFKVGEMLWGRREGLVAAFLLCVNAYHIRYSQEARFYALMIFLLLLSLIFLLKALERGHKRWWVLFALCNTLNLYNHYLAFPFFAAESLFSAWVVFHDWWVSRHESLGTSLDSDASAQPDQQSAVPVRASPLVGPSPQASSPLPDVRKQALNLLAAVTLVGLSYVPWLPSLFQQLRGSIIQYEGLGIGTLPQSEFSVRFFWGALETYTQVEGIVLLLFLVLFGLGLATSRTKYIVLFGLWLVAPFVTPFIVRAGHFFSYRYAIPVIPILSLGMARGISVLKVRLTRRLPEMRDHQKARIALFSIVTVSIFGGLAVRPVTQYYAGEKDDYRGVARYLQQTLQPGDVVVTDGVRYQRGQDAGWTQYCTAYYMDSYHMEQTPILPVERGFWANLHEVEQSKGEIFAVLASRKQRAAWRNQTRLTVVEFEGLYVARLPQPSGDLLQDGVPMLEALTGLLRVSAVGSFDVHLALAEAYADLNRQADTDSQIVLASTVMPDADRAAEDLAKTINELHPFLRVQLQDLPLGDTLAVRGYRVSPTILQAGEAVDITLWWEVVAAMERDYTAFIHILGPHGEVLAREDQLLRYATRPTSKWRVGEVATNDYQVLLPSDAEPGQYIIKTGVYYWETGERLPIWDGEGNRLPEDALTLQPISVVASD